MASLLKTIIGVTVIAGAMALPQKAEAQKTSYTLESAFRLHKVEPMTSIWETVPGARFSIKREIKNIIKPYLSFSRYHKKKLDSSLEPKLDIYKAEAGLEMDLQIDKETKINFGAGIEGSRHFYGYDLNGEKFENNYKFAGKTFSLGIQREINNWLDLTMGYRWSFSKTKKEDIQNEKYKDIVPMNNHEFFLGFGVN